MITKKLTTRLITDLNVILTAELISINGYFATIIFEGKKKRCKIYTSEFDGCDYIFPLGKYSIAPIFRL